jgi:hypothetical protein
MRRIAVAAAILSLGVGVLAVPSYAGDETNTVDAKIVDEHTATLAVVFTASNRELGRAKIPPSRGGTGERWSCYYYPFSTISRVTNVDGTYVDEKGGPVTLEFLPTENPKAGEKYVFECYAGSKQMIKGPDETQGHLVVTYDPNRPAAPLFEGDPETEIINIYLDKGLTARKASYQLSPAPPIAQLVGIPTWYWLTDAHWDRDEIALPLPLSGITARLTATARAQDAVEFRPGDGSPPTFCNGPGVVYGGQPDSATRCRHTYTSASGPGGYGGAIIVHYDVRWDAPGYPGGELPGGIESIPAPVPVVVKGTQAVERQPGG